MQKLKGVLRPAPALLGVALLVGAIYVVQKEFRHLKIADIGHALHEIPDDFRLIALGGTTVLVCILPLLDRLRHHLCRQEGQLRQGRLRFVLRLFARA